MVPRPKNGRKKSVNIPFSYRHLIW